MAKAKTKTKEKAAVEKAVEPAVAEVAKVEPVIPVVETVPSTATVAAPAPVAAAAVAPVAPVVTPVAPVQPAQTVIIEKKSGGGCWKWFACCLVVLLLCCACTFGSIYLLVFKGGDIVKAITNSKQDTTLVRLTSADVAGFDLDTYYAENPPTDLGNGRAEMIISEETLLKMFFTTPADSYLLDYLGMGVTEGSLKFQIDIGGLLKRDLDANGGYKVLGVPVDTSNLAGIYLNVELAIAGENQIILKSARLGESSIDIAPYLQDMLSEYTSGATEGPTENIETIEFKDGYIRIVFTGDMSDLPIPTY